MNDTMLWTVALLGLGALSFALAAIAFSRVCSSRRTGRTP
jgi:hypothetical protein